MRSRTTAGAVIIARSATVAFDATIRESHDARMEVTRHEVEAGSPAGGNVRSKPREIELILVSTDSPLVELNDVTESRDMYVVRTLEAIMRKAEIVGIKCHLGRFEGYVIESVTTPVTAQDGASLSPQVKLVEYRQVATTTIVTPDAYLDALVSDTASQPSAPESGSISAGVGSEEGPPPPSSVAAQIYDSVTDDNSALFSAADALRGFLQ